MKKTITLLLAMLMVLSACGKTEMLFQEVKDEYDTIASSIENGLENGGTMLNEDYLNAISQIASKYEDIKKGISDKNIDAAQEIYGLAHKLEYVANLFDSDIAKTIASFAASAKTMIEAAYDDVDADFETSKKDFEAKLEEVQNLAAEDFDEIQKKAKLTWNEVEDQFSEIEETALNDLTALKELDSYELEELKHDIIDNYDAIKDGVTEDGLEAAKKMYYAAIRLKAYMEDVGIEESEAVSTFADKTINYVKCALFNVEGDAATINKEFEDGVASAKKWTQSTWNKITTEIGISYFYNYDTVE